MLFLTSLSSYDSPVYKAMLSHQSMFGRFYSDPRNMQDMNLWDKWALDNGAISSLNRKVNLLAGKRITTFSLEYMNIALRVIQGNHDEWFNLSAFFKTLEKVTGYSKTNLFVVVPDVPFSWDKTLESYHHWHRTIQNLGFKRAIAVQNGANPDSICWSDCDAIFIGGDTEWKRAKWRLPDGEFSAYSPYQEIDAIAITKEAIRRGKHVHYGRQANSIQQLINAYQWGASSIDGTAETKAPNKQFKWISKIMWELHNQDKLKERWVK